MKLSEIARLLDAKIHSEGDVCADPVSVYAGDFLSRVMGKAPPGSIWLTVMSNINVAGVAALADIKAVVLCEDVMPDKLLTEKCKNENIALFTTALSVYECCKKL